MTYYAPDTATVSWNDFCVTLCNISLTCVCVFVCTHIFGNTVVNRKGEQYRREGGKLGGQFPVQFLFLCCKPSLTSFFPLGPDSLCPFPSLLQSHRSHSEPEAPTLLTPAREIQVWKTGISVQDAQQQRTMYGRQWRWFSTLYIMWKSIKTSPVSIASIASALSTSINVL